MTYVRIYYNGGFFRDKYIYDESNGLWYELQGDYYIPCLTLPAEKEHKPISLWDSGTNAIYRNLNGQFTPRYSQVEN